MESELIEQGVDQKTLLQQADQASLVAGKELKVASAEAAKLLADIRNVIALRDQDDLASPATNTTPSSVLL